MDTVHRLEVTAGTAALLYECAEGCGRRLAVDRDSGRLTVLDRGDQLVQHYGSSGGIDLRPIGLEHG